MSTFNITRFGQALKCQFVVERKSFIRVFGIFTLVMFMANLFFTRVNGPDYNSLLQIMSAEELYLRYKSYVEQTLSFGLMFFCIAMLFGATGMFSQMKDTRTRSAYLLWPVSNMEKYLASLILAIFLMAVLTVGAFMLADALRVFVDWVTGRVVIWGFPRLIEPVEASTIDDWQMAWMFFTWVFYIHSLYIAGGTLFRRQQFLFTSATIVVIAILLVTILNQAHFQIEFINGVWDEKTLTYTKTYYPFFYVLNSVLCALIVFNYWLSYKLFTRMQVINNKWLNV